MSLKVLAHLAPHAHPTGCDPALASDGERPVLRAGSGRSDAEQGDGEAGSPEPVAKPAEFDAVYDEHFAFVWRSLRMLGVAEGALEDAAQDVFAVVSRQLTEFRGLASLRTWLFSIVQRTAANYRRKHRRKIQPLVPLGEVVVGHEPTPHAHAEAQEAANRIDAYCDTLDAERRALFVLVLLEEVPAPEVSRALGLPINTVYSRVRSLRAGLQRALRHDEEEPDGRA